MQMPDTELAALLSKGKQLKTAAAHDQKGGTSLACYAGAFLQKGYIWKSSSTVTH